VAFFVREKYRAKLEAAGLSLYPLHRERNARSQPVLFRPAQVLTDWAEGARTHWDWVVLAVPSNALREAWMDRCLESIGEARVLALQLGVGDEEWLRAKVGEKRLFLGMINLISFAVPLQGLAVPEPGTAYWFPPLSRMPFSGPDYAGLEEWIQLLRRGGMRASRVRSATATTRVPEHVLTALVTALELKSWRFSGLKDRAAVELALEAAEEKGVVADALAGRKRSSLFRLLRPGMLKWGVALAERLLPLPLEEYIRVHFTKVNAQFQRDRRTLIQAAKGLGLPVPALEQLDRRLAEQRGEAVD
jgi:2-dehydropantoate 2-reductase